MKISIRRILGLSLLGLMLATTAVPSFANPQGKKSGKKGSKGKSQKKGGKGSGK